MATGEPGDLGAVFQAPKEAGGRPVSDQQLPAFVIVDDENQPVGRVEDDDVVVIFNFRADRVVELSKALELEKFDKFDRKRHPKVCTEDCIMKHKHGNCRS